MSIRVQQSSSKKLKAALAHITPEYAIIEYGSNSIRVALYKNDKEDSFVRTKTIRADLSLADALQENGSISAETQKQLIQITQDFLLQAKAAGAPKIFAYATGALRSSKNSSDTIQKIRSHTDLNVRLLSGGEEAELAYQAMDMQFEAPLHGIVADMGGQSFELIEARKGKKKNDISLNIGVRNITEQTKLGKTFKKARKTMGIDKATQKRGYFMGGIYRELFKAVGAKELTPEEFEKAVRDAQKNPDIKIDERRSESDINAALKTVKKLSKKFGITKLLSNNAHIRDAVIAAIENGVFRAQDVQDLTPPLAAPAHSAPRLHPWVIDQGNQRPSQLLGEFSNSANISALPRVQTEPRCLGHPSEKTPDQKPALAA